MNFLAFLKFFSTTLSAFATTVIELIELQKIDNFLLLDL